MQSTLNKKLVIKCVCLLILAFATFEVSSWTTSAASRECPPEVYANCWQPGAQYIVDSETCACTCPEFNAACISGRVDQTDCTCIPPGSGGGGCNIEDRNLCAIGSGNWDESTCYCHYY